jgi:hypothetical protein
MAESKRAASSTEFARGPSTVRGLKAVGRRSDAMTPVEGRNPTTPQKAAGVRQLPPLSEPVAKGTIPAARAAAAPPDDPLLDSLRSKGLRVGPKTEVAV